MNAHTKSGATWPKGDAFERAEAEHNWLVCRLVRRDSGKLDKVPQSPQLTTGNAARGRNASKDDAAALTLKQALKLQGELNRALGLQANDDGSYAVGYLARKGSALVGVDLDHCVSDGTVADWARNAFLVGNPYAEVSPSGTGIRVLLPRHDDPESDKGGDFYQEERKFPKGEAGEGVGWFGSDSKFFTLTMRPLEGHEVVQDAPAVRDNVRKVLASIRSSTAGAVPARPAPVAAPDGLVSAAAGMFAPNDDLKGGLNQSTHFITALAARDPELARECLRDALASIQVPPGGDYDHLWLPVMFSCRSIGEAWAREEFLSWSAGQQKSHPLEDAELYDKAKEEREEAESIGPGRVFWHARQAGWEEGPWLARMIAADAPQSVGDTVDKLAAGIAGGAKKGLDSDLSHATYADLMAATCSDRYRYNHQSGRWVWWDGEGWRPDRKEVVLNDIRQKLSAHLALLGKAIDKRHRKTMGSSGFGPAILKMMQSMPEFATAADDWDADPWLLGIPGGLVDLKAVKILPPDPTRMVAKCTAVAPETGVPALWTAFVADTFRKPNGERDEEMERYVQKLLGYCLTGDTLLHQFWFCWGDGGNGKGVFLNTARAILADYAATAAFEVFLVQRTTGHATEVASLAGARLIVASEVPEGAKWNTQRLKAFASTDKMSARFLYQDNFEFTPTGKLVFAANKRPSLGTVDAAMVRRLNLLPFLNKPARRDLGLEKKLVAEYPRILNWMLEGLRMFHAEGLERPKPVEAATDAYLASEDTFRVFMNECFELAPQGGVPLKDVAERLKEWVDAGAGDWPPGYTGSPQSIRKLLEARHAVVGMTAGRYVWRNVKLRKTAPAPLPARPDDGAEQAVQQLQQRLLGGSTGGAPSASLAGIAASRAVNPADYADRRLEVDRAENDDGEAVE